jgi:hypothetical protein
MEIDCSLYATDFSNLVGLSDPTLVFVASLDTDGGNKRCSQLRDFVAHAGLASVLARTLSSLLLHRHALFPKGSSNCLFVQ